VVVLGIKYRHRFEYARLPVDPERPGAGLPIRHAAQVLAQLLRGEAEYRLRIGKRNASDEMSSAWMKHGH
jgi:hypothetical protein